MTGGQMWSLVPKTGVPPTPAPRFSQTRSTRSIWSATPGSASPASASSSAGATYKTQALYRGGVGRAGADHQLHGQRQQFRPSSSSAASGQSGGLYNAAASNGGTSNITTYANNVAPDVIVKAAFDNPMTHIEIGGLGRFMRDYYFPVSTINTGGTLTYS
jgi:hypothetical protein